MLQSDFSFIYKYFTAEKQESLLFIIIGIIAIIIAVIFFFFIKTNTALFKGAIVPLLVLGIIELVAGYTVYVKSDKQSASVAYNIGLEANAYANNKEIPRMETVMKNFIIYRWVEMALIIAGLVLVFLYRSNPDKSFWYGFGIAVAIQATIMLGADYFAEKRGKVYTAQLQEMLVD